MKHAKLYRSILPFWKKEALILFLSLVSVGLSLINPYLAKLIIDKAYANKDLRLFIVLTVAAAAILVLNGLLNAFTRYLNRYVIIRIKFSLEQKLFRKLQALSYTFFQDSSTGEHLFKINYDIEQAGRLIADILPKAVTFIPRIILILAVLFYLDWKISLLALAVAGFLYFVPYYFSRRLRKALKERVENSQGIFDRLQEVFSHMQLVKALGKERIHLKHYLKSSVENTRMALRNSRLETLSLFVSNLCGHIALGSIVFFGGYQVIRGRLTLGTLSAITIYLSQLYGLQNSLAQFFQEISFGLISCERLEAVLEAEPGRQQDKPTKQIILLRGDVEFRGVTFGYRPDRPVLQDLSFKIDGGSCVGLTGPSGCGKTTLINLFLRLFRLGRGQILIDGQDIALIEPESFHSRIGAVPQEPFLWNNTIEYNIKYGREEAGLAEVIAAARAACIDDFVSTLAAGYATAIGENACRLSEGQKQRIAIARALINKPKILVMDEALSCVDSRVEGMIIDNVRRMLPASTLLVISHRLSTIKKMDRVYFLSQPDRLEINTHEALLGENARYRDYLTRQLENAVVA